MRALPFLTFLLASWNVEARAAARESVTAQAARVQVLLHAIQEGPQLKPELARNLRQTIVSSQKQLAKDQLSMIIKPGRVPPEDPLLLMIKGERFVLPKIEGQRSCEAIKEDWRALDLVYNEVNDLALQLEEVYSHPQLCAPCADSVLASLKQATEELESISTRLSEDGARQVVVIWGPQAFVENRKLIFTALNWDKLIYYNIDGDSRVGTVMQPLPPLPGLNIRSPILQKGIQFQTDSTAERACSPGFEIRLDGLAKGMIPVERLEVLTDLTRERLRTVPVNLILLSSY
jgi:hypothetical protein